MSPLASAHPVRTTAAQATVGDFRDAVEFLSENLGSGLLALAVGVNTRTIGRWLSDPTRTPHLDTEKRLRDTYQVFTMVLEVDAAPVVRAWFMGMNSHLEDRSPAEAIADGDSRLVLAAARAWINAA